MSKFLICKSCKYMTTQIESEDRNFNTGRCGNCNGELEQAPTSHAAGAVSPVRDDELREKLHLLMGSWSLADDKDDSARKERAVDEVFRMMEADRARHVEDACAQAVTAALERVEASSPKDSSNELIQLSLQNGKPQQAASYNGYNAANNQWRAAIAAEKAKLNQKSV